MITCQNNGTCNFNSSSNVYICQCVNNFYGPNCQYQPLNSTTFINSTILTQELGVSLMNLIGIPSNSIMSKIYQASKDGFGAKDFHSKVDNITGTYTIIKSINGNIFGGFISGNWGSQGYVNDIEAYIFSLINQQKYPCKLLPKDSNTFLASQAYGPIFGGGNDIFISDLSNINNQSYSNLGTTYKLNQLIQSITTPFEFLAGSQNFQTFEIETYKSKTFKY